MTKNNPSRPGFLVSMHQTHRNEEMTTSWWFQSSVVSLNLHQTFNA